MLPLIPTAGLIAIAASAVLLMWYAHRRHPYSIPFILIYGDEPAAKEFIANSRKHSASGLFRFVGCIATNGNHADNIDGIPVVGRSEHFGDYLLRNPVDTVIYASKPSPSTTVLQKLDPALRIGARVGLLDAAVPDVAVACERITNVEREEFLGHSIAFVNPLPRRTLYHTVKRITDVVVSAAALVVLSPVFLLISVCIKLSSHGPVFYPWRVLGKNGKPFVGYKFRTMVPNADELKQELMHMNEMSGPVFKIKKDPRITPVGRILRKFSLDELPQFYSVLKGDMSLVGPRPPSKEEADKFELWQRAKLNVKPGITCLWQVEGRSHITDFNEWARLDLEYIRIASWWVDLKILVRTVPVVLRGHGAY